MILIYKIIFIKYSELNILKFSLVSSSKSQNSLIPNISIWARLYLKPSLMLIKHLKPTSVQSLKGYLMLIITHLGSLTADCPFIQRISLTLLPLGSAINTVLHSSFLKLDGS